MAKINVIYKQQIVNFPDYQTRVVANKPQLRWEGKVHEMINGAMTYASLPADIDFIEYCLFHEKTIEKQELQNNFYDTI